MKTIIVGAAGKQGKFYIDLLESMSELVGIVDPNIASLPLELKHKSRNAFTDLDSAIADADFDVALICVPHHKHFELTKKILQAGKAVIKEKPFATSLYELKKYVYLMRKHEKPVFTIAQRNHHQSFKQAQKSVAMIGKPLAYTYHYFLSVERNVGGWRNDVTTGKGGAILDMGYHIFNVVNKFFGVPAEIISHQINVDSQNQLGIEHFANVQLVHANGMVGNISISPHMAEKDEALSVLGASGSLKVTPKKLMLKMHEANVPAVSEVYNLGKVPFRLQMADFLNNIDNQDFIAAHIKEQQQTMKFIFDAYKSRCISSC